ncbi:MAG: phosphoheptose isomerase [Bacteroidetes bacterium]|nr:MAG: phosphoheptose isomerase [Bacteroidota bacterium]
MTIAMSALPEKNEVFAAVAAYIQQQGFTVASQDFNRPWGGFFVLQEADAPAFVEAYFPGYTAAQLTIGNKLSPKFLVVAPGMRLSWQYHHRRAEIWRVLQNDVKVATSLTNDETTPKTYTAGQIVVLQKGERHRLIGADTYGIVAEVWQHTDVLAPSDEDDIVRLQDDFGR